MDWLPFVGILVALVSVGIALAGLILVTMRNTRADMKALEERLNKRIDEGLETLSGQVNKLSERVGRLEEGQVRLLERLGRVEEGQTQLSERLGRVEGGQAQLSERLGRLEQEQARMNGVLETVPERLGRLEQEQARMNGVLETIRAGLSYRVERADVGDRVAEESESYESQE